MIRNAYLVFAVLVSLLSIPARAILPESGWYWNSNESGRGFNIEIQDNTVFMASFAYGLDGAPLWYVSSGQMSSDRNFTAPLYVTSQGQCIGCGYRQPTTTQVGTATIFFNTERSATVTLLGVTLNLVRYDWSGWGSSSRDALLGEWVTTTGETSFPVYFGERVTLYAQGQSTAGPYAGGNRTGDSTHLAVGIFDVASGKFSILLDSSTSYWDLYIFDLKTFSRAEGQNWVYLKSSSPSGNGLFFVAHRTKSGAQVRTGIGPGINKLAPVAPIDESTIDAMMAVRAKAQLEQGAVDPLVVETARKLEALLR